MKKKTIVTTLILIIFLGTTYLIFSNTNSKQQLQPDSNALSTDIQIPPESKKLNSISLPKEYSNTTYKFSLKMPEEFTAREIKSENSNTVLLENKKGQGIQITISPFDNTRVLTAEMIHADLPDFKIINSQTVKIEDGYEGISFQSDNPSFAGASSEIWFIFHSNLYQISTYSYFDDLLKNIFETWKFSL